MKSPTNDLIPCYRLILDRNHPMDPIEINRMVRVIMAFLKTQYGPSFKSMVLVENQKSHNDAPSPDIWSSSTDEEEEQLKMEDLHKHTIN